ncbi:16S rRNA (guanine(527)-N(7))-methyltransferase RsmG [Thermogutta sp.]|uniref:16S rRNA (guanine(527)-N(7))-methyltransferase RsmG n=1 Tax=Thermogutta sp. TaxID=1962930 RepID=UPI00321F8A54
MIEDNTTSNFEKDDFNGTQPPVTGDQPNVVQPAQSAAEPPATTPQTLEETLAEYGISLFPEQIRQLDRYFHLRNEWNAQMNLTRHTDYRKFVGRDIIDTLSFARVLQPDEVVLDVGTGSGVPGIVLAILRPDLQIALCESVGKRARAVADMCEKLELPLPILVGKAENFLAAGGWEFHSLIVRAVATLLELMRWFKPYWSCFDRMLLLKGPTWVEERGQARHYGVMHGYALRVVDRYTVPDTGAESVLLQVCPEDRLVPPRGCRLRKLRYEVFPTGLITPDQPGPLARFHSSQKQSGKKESPAQTPQRGEAKPANRRQEKSSQSRKSRKDSRNPTGQAGQAPATGPSRKTKMKSLKRKGDQREKSSDEKSP